ncbi:MAG: hypothetical protein LBL52_00875 [Rickettsiales bacterium]|jgi:FMN phosphatase YigB (HAD superfamily)|nr:hypothetical protein [Rickettsiales bacterium]
MIIALDCDEVLLATGPVVKDFYLATIDPAAEIPDGVYSSYWPVWGERGSEEAKLEWLRFLDDYTHSEYLTKSLPVEGAADGVRALAALGHKLHVLTAIGDDEDVKRRRVRHLRSLFGDAFEDIVCIGPFEKKKDWLVRMDAGALIDDGTSNISGALELGLLGVLFRCAENSALIDEIMSTGRVEQSFWRRDGSLVRDKAVIADGWRGAVRAIEKSPA